MLQGAYQASACITHANVQLVKASHMAISKVNVRRDNLRL